jgi:hypothetical protein
MPIRSLHHVRAFVQGALRALPIETAAVAAAAASLLWMVQYDDVDPGPLRVLCAAPITCALAFVLTLLARAGRIGRAAQVVGGAAIGGAVLAAVWLTMPTQDGEAFAWSYAASLLAAILIPFPAVALAAPAGDDRVDAFSSFLRRFLEQTTVWLLLGAAALAAIGVVFAALHGLFDLDVERHGLRAAIAVAAVITLAWLYHLLPGAGPAQVPAIWRRLVTAIGAPFVATMLVILAAYEVWALARQELPRNMLSPLVIGAGAVGSLCTLVIVAIARQPAAGLLAPADRHPWMAAWPVRIARAFPLALLALAPMACWALAVRIDDLGLTPMRVARLYALIALVVIAAAGSVRYLRRRPPLGWQVPAVVAALALIAAIGPLGLVSVSLRSQAARLDAMLTASGVTGRAVGAGAPMVTVPFDRYQALISSLDVLDDLGGEDGLRRVLTGDVAACHHDIYSCLEKLGVRSVEAPPYQPRWIQATASAPFAVGSNVVSVVRLSGSSTTSAGGVELAVVDTRIEARQGGRVVAVADLTAAATAALGSPELAAVPTPFTGEGAARLGHLLVTELTVTRGERVAIESVAAVWIRPAD